MRSSLKKFNSNNFLRIWKFLRFSSVFMSKFSFQIRERKIIIGYGYYKIRDLLKCVNKILFSARKIEKKKNGKVPNFQKFTYHQCYEIYFSDALIKLQIFYAGGIILFLTLKLTFEA